MLAPAGFDPARDIVGITVNRWPHGYAYEYNPLWDPDWPEGQSPCEIARKRYGRIVIANSDAAAAAYTSSRGRFAAAAEAEVVGVAVAEALGEMLRVRHLAVAGGEFLPRLLGELLAPAVELDGVPERGSLRREEREPLFRRSRLAGLSGLEERRHPSGNRAAHVDPSATP